MRTVNRRGVSWAVAYGAAVQLALAAGCSSAWPTVQAVGDARFMNGVEQVRSIDVLPIDVQLWTHRKNKRNPVDIAQSFDAAALGIVSGDLAGHGYAVNTLGWDGKFVTPAGALATAMSPDEVAETVYSLSSYGVARHRAGGALLSPHLPHRLGETTGADATLYVGGWAYAGDDDRSGTGKQVAKGLLIAALIAVVVVVVIASAKGGGKGGGGVGGLARGAGRAAHAGVKVAGRMVGGATRVGARAASDIARGMANADINLHIDLDCFGRSSTHYDHYAARPDYYRETVPKTGRSKMLIEMTLVDNRTGHILWHARQRFSASAEKQKHIGRALHGMLETMP